MSTILDLGRDPAMAIRTLRRTLRGARDAREAEKRLEQFRPMPEGSLSVVQTGIEEFRVNFLPKRGEPFAVVCPR